jgi:uncharacterized protein YcbK (DUF882 family)
MPFLILCHFGCNQWIMSFDTGKSGLALIPGILVAGLLLCPEPALSIDERRLSFYHTHTAQRLDVVYSRGGQYIDSALDDIEHFLSDFRTGDRRAIDPGLLDFIHDVRESLGSDGTFEVISAYRSPKTNEMLRSRSNGVAENSQHTIGKAIDVRLQGVDLRRLRDAAIELQRGGVGYYAASNFVHLDTGRVRRW